MAGTSYKWSAGIRQMFSDTPVRESGNKELPNSVTDHTPLLSDGAGIATPTFWFLMFKIFPAHSNCRVKALPNPPIESTGRKDFQKKRSQ